MSAGNSKGHWAGHVWGPKETPEAAKQPAEEASPLAKASLPEREAAPGEQARGAEADDGINKESLRAKIVVKDPIDVTYDDIKGQDKAVAEIRELDQHLRYPEVYQSWGVEIPKGVLFFGPPGTGKTMMAKALAGSAQFAFLEATCADINNKYFGNPERYAEAVFDIANEEAANHPSKHAILFLDEVEALLKERDDRTFDAAENVLSIFLTRIDGLVKGGKVIIVAATNRPDKLDSAFISRMDKLIEVPLPDATGVSAILEGRCRKGEKRSNNKVLGEIDYAGLGKDLLGLSGRELDQLANAALKEKAAEHVARLEHAKQRGLAAETVQRPDPVSTADLARAAVKSAKISAIIGPKRTEALKTRYDPPRENALAEGSGEPAIPSVPPQAQAKPDAQIRV